MLEKEERLGLECTRLEMEPTELAAGNNTAAAAAVAFAVVAVAVADILTTVEQCNNT